MGLVYCYLRGRLKCIYWCVRKVSNYIGNKTGSKNGSNLGIEIVSKVRSKTGSKNPLFAFLKCMNGSVFGFPKCMVSLKFMDGSYWPTSGFPSNLPPLDFHSRGIPVYNSYNERKHQMSYLK